MADPSSPFFYVKNYRAHRVRLNQKYSGSNSVLNLNSQDGSSAWGRPDSGSTLSLAGNTHPDPKSRSQYSHGRSWTPRVSLVSAVKLAGFGTQSSETDENAEGLVGNNEVSGMSRSFHPPMHEYRRTLSGGTEWRSNSADPEHALSLLRGNYRTDHFWDDDLRSTSVERPFNSFSNGLRYGRGLGLIPKFSSSIASLDRVGHGSDFGSINHSRVSAFARDVSSYPWDKSTTEDFQGSQSNSLNQSQSCSHPTNGLGLNASSMDRDHSFLRPEQRNDPEKMNGETCLVNGTIPPPPPFPNSAEQRNNYSETHQPLENSWTKKRRRTRNDAPSFLGPEDHLTLARVSVSSIANSWNLKSFSLINYVYGWVLFG